MVPTLPHTSPTQTGVPLIQYAAAPNVQAKASALTGEVVHARMVQPVDKSEELQNQAAQAVRKSVIEEIPLTRSEILEKGAAFLSSPEWPPLTAVNGVATIFIHDYFLKANERTA